MENQYGFIEKTVTLKIINGTKVRKKQRFQFNACTVITRKLWNMKTNLKPKL